MSGFPNAQNNPRGAIPVYMASAPVQTWTPKGYEQISNPTVATGLTVPDGAVFAVISVSGWGVRYRDDGVDPTSALGMPLFAGAVLNYNGPLDAIKFINQSGGSQTPVLDILYYGP